MNDEMFRLSLIDVMNANLLNGLVNTIFGYDFNENEYVYYTHKDGTISTCPEIEIK